MNSGHWSTPSATGYGYGEPLNVAHVGLWDELLAIVLKRPADHDGILYQMILSNVQ